MANTYEQALATSYDATTDAIATAIATNALVEEAITEAVVEEAVIEAAVEAGATVYNVTAVRGSASGFMLDSEFGNFMDVAVNYMSENPLLTASYYSTAGYPDVFYVNRLSGLDYVIYNLENIDQVVFVDTTSANLVGYNIYNYEASGAAAPIFDLVFDTGQVVQFQNTAVPAWGVTANGETMAYNYQTQSFMTAAELGVADYFWSTAAITDANAYADGNIFVSQAYNNAVINADGYDNIYLYDAAGPNISGIDVSPTTISIMFSNGSLTVVQTESDYSPTFHLGSGESYVFDRKDGLLKTTEQINAEAVASMQQSAWADSLILYTDNQWGTPNVVDNFFVSQYSPITAVNNAEVIDTVHFYDATLDDILNVDVKSNGDIEIDFLSGSTTYITPVNNNSAAIKLASGEVYSYNYAAQGWQRHQ